MALHIRHKGGNNDSLKEKIPQTPHLANHNGFNNSDDSKPFTTKEKKNRGTPYLKINRYILVLRRYFMSRSTYLGISLLLVFSWYMIVFDFNEIDEIDDEKRMNQISKGGILDLKKLGYKAKPRLFVYYISDDSTQIIRSQRLPVYPTSERYPSKRTVHISHESLKAQHHLVDSRDYAKVRAEPIVDPPCFPQHDWQTKTYPSCNALLEIDVMSLLTMEESDTHGRLINNGAYRDVWVVSEFDGSKRILKTLRYKREYEDRHFDRHRRDAVAMERLTSSPNILDIYGFCGTSGLFEFGPGGDITRFLWPKRSHGESSKLSKKEKYQIAIQVAMGIADVHAVDTDKGNNATAAIAHTDITLDQFIFIDGFFKLNDFNRARFLRRNKDTGEPCGFRVGSNKGKFRSPEEYEYNEEDEKVDIYSMGNIFYTLLTEQEPWRDVKDEKSAQRKVMRGERPAVPSSIAKERNAYDLALIKAMEMCHIHDPKKRATARLVLHFLTEQLKVIEGKE